MRSTTLYTRSIILTIWFSIFLANANAQIRFGPSSGIIDGSVSVDIKSGPFTSGSIYRGLLLPTVTTTQRGQIQNPAIGLLIFNATTKQIEVNTGTASSPVWTPSGAASSGGSAWSITGNAGTVSTTNFLGTTDNVPLAFRVNNQNAGRIDAALYNVALGYMTLSSSTTGQGNTASGTFTLANNTTGNYNTAAGFQALNSNTTGSGNTALGTVALSINNSGHDNTALGTVTLQNNTTGSYNTASGTIALQNNTTGNYNTAIGAGALQKNTSANGNTALGHNALSANTTGNTNIGIGEDALSGNIDGRDNLAVGVASLASNSSGVGNIASGNLALRSNTTGQNNTASGLLALFNNTTGNYNTALGYNAGPSSANAALNNATAIGANTVSTASNQIVLGDNNVTSLRCNVQTISSLSDRRIKKNIQTNVPGLNFITKLAPVTYNVDKLKEAKLVGYPLANVREDKTLHSGFIAQDVEAAAQAVGYNFDGVHQEEGKYYTLGYTLFIMPLVQAVKELNTEVEQLKRELMVTKETERSTQARLDKLETLLNERPVRAAISRKPTE